MRRRRAPNPSASDSVSRVAGLSAQWRASCVIETRQSRDERRACGRGHWNWRNLNMTTQAKGTDATRREMLRLMLVTLRDETYERVQELRHEQADDAELAPGDEMDRARADVDVETHASLIARAEERLRYIDEALGRVFEGRYGICAECREHIAVERLGALPFAIYCVAC